MEKKDYIGASAFGLKISTVLPGTPLQGKIVEVVKKPDEDVNETIALVYYQYWRFLIQLKHGRFSLNGGDEP